MLLAAALALSTIRETTVVVAYRERIALPAGAEIAVTISRYPAGGGQTEIASAVVRPQGRQVPFPVRLTYVEEGGGRIAAIAEIRANGRRLFASPSAVDVRPNGRVTLNLGRVRDAGRASGIADLAWTLFSISGRAVASVQNAPTVRFGSDGKLTGFGGVNRFGGRVSLTPPTIQVDPGPRTLMAGPPEKMRQEDLFLRELARANRVALSEGDLVLSRGETELLRFRAAR